MKAFKFANVVAKTLGLENLVPAYTTITFAIVSKTGALGAYVDSGGFLVNKSGSAFSTSNSITHVTITDPGSSGATLTLATSSTLATSGAHSITLTSTADTNVTLPTTGTLATLAGTETLSNKIIEGSIQALSGAGAVNVTTDTTRLTTTGSAQALTLADGAAGQIKRIIHEVDGGSAVLTPTTKTGFSTITFTNAGDTATLEFLATRGWCILSVNGATIA